MVQIRSHAQKYFLKAQKLGLAAALPPPQPRRGAVLSPLAASHPDGDSHGNAAVGMGMAAAPAWPLPATSPPPRMSSTDFAAPSGAQEQSADWPSCSGGPSEAWAADDAMLQVDDTIQLLSLSPGMKYWLLASNCMCSLRGCWKNSFAEPRWS